MRLRRQLRPKYNARASRTHTLALLVRGITRGGFEHTYAIPPTRPPHICCIRETPLDVRPRRRHSVVCIIQKHITRACVQYNNNNNIHRVYARTYAHDSMTHTRITHTPFVIYVYIILLNLLLFNRDIYV